MSLGLLPGWTLLAFIGVQVKDVVPWPELRQSLSAGDPVQMALWVSALALTMALLCILPVRSAVYAPGLRGLWRQPIAAPQWGLVFAPWVMLAALPLAAVSGLWPHPHWVSQAIVWSALWTVAVMGLASLTLHGFAIGLVAIGALGLAAFSMWSMPLLAPALAVAALAVLPVSVGLIWERTRRPTRRWRPSLPGRPFAAFDAMVRRDLLCLLRSSPGVLFASLIPPIPAFIALVALRNEGVIAGPASVGAGLIVLGFTSPVVGSAFATLSDRLGPMLDPPRWPMEPFARALALTVLGEMLMLPTALAVLAAVFPEGMSVGLRLVLASSAISAVGVWCLAQNHGNPEPGAVASWHLLAALLVCVIGTLPWPWSVVVLAAVVFGALSDAANALERSRGRVI